MYRFLCCCLPQENEDEIHLPTNPARQQQQPLINTDSRENQNQGQNQGQGEPEPLPGSSREVTGSALKESHDLVDGEPVDDLSDLLTKDNIFQGHLSQSHRDPPLQLYNGVYYSPLEIPETENPEIDSKKFQLVENPSPNPNQNPIRFQTSAGQEYLKAVYEGCHTILTRTIKKHCLQLYRVLYSKNLADFRKTGKDKETPTHPKDEELGLGFGYSCGSLLNPQDLEIFRERLTDLLVQLNYYQCDLQGRVAPPLTREEREKFTPENVTEFHLDLGFECDFCTRAFKMKEQFYFLGCLHHFHVHCFEKWIEYSGMCPECCSDLTKML